MQITFHLLVFQIYGHLFWKCKVPYTALYNIQGEAKVRKHKTFCLLQISWSQ